MSNLGQAKLISAQTALNVGAFWNGAERNTVTPATYQLKFVIYFIGMKCTKSTKGSLEKSIRSTYELPSCFGVTSGMNATVPAQQQD